MYVLINLDAMAFVATGNYQALCAQAHTQFSQNAAWLVGPVEKKTFSDFTETELRLLYKSASGNDSASITKWQLPEACLQLAAQVKPTSPFDIPATPVMHEATPAAPAEASQRPKAGTATGRVWEIADELLQNEGPHFFNSKGLKLAVVAKAVAEGINASTAQVQFSKWKKHQ